MFDRIFLVKDEVDMSYRKGLQRWINRYFGKDCGGVSTEHHSS